VLRISRSKGEIALLAAPMKVERISSVMSSGETRRSSVETVRDITVKVNARGTYRERT
jgi:hypothetical protein